MGRLEARGAIGSLILILNRSMMNDLLEFKLSSLLRAARSVSHLINKRPIEPSLGPPVKKIVMTPAFRSTRTSQEKARVKRALVDDTVAKINARVMEKLKVEADIKVETPGVHVYTSSGVQPAYSTSPASVTPVTLSSTGRVL